MLSCGNRGCGGAVWSKFEDSGSRCGSNGCSSGGSCSSSDCGLMDTLRYVLVLEILFFGVAQGTTTLTADNGGGFSVTRLSSLNLFALQCNGSHLPSDVRSVQHISLQRYSQNPVVSADIIASLSSVDGVRLEKSEGNQNMYVNGIFDVDNIKATSLTVLLNDVKHDEVTYGCTISYTKRGGMLDTVQRMLNVTALDIQNMYRVDDSVEDNDEEKVEEEREGWNQTPRLASSARSDDRKQYWNTPMILLVAMASLLVILFVVCLLLVIDRCKENRRQRKRTDRLNKKKNSGANSPTMMDHESRPLPPPPDWTYPPGTAVPPYKSPYHRLRLGAGGRNLPDDTGYDSDASMIYCRPYDDVGEVIAEKTALETFGKRLPPMYTHDQIMFTKS